MRLTFFSGSVIAVIGSIVACATANPNAVNASEFDRSCSHDTDCVNVFSGDVCSTDCACPNAAIAKSALGDYQARQRDDASRCGGGRVNVCSCIATQPVCAGGTCSLTARDGG